MKLLSRLRQPQQEEILPPITVILNEINANAEHEEHLGVGAATAPDVFGMEFADGTRRRIPDIHEDYPPLGMSYDQFIEEAEA